jgi:hypothetical protein
MEQKKEFNVLKAVEAQVNKVSMIEAYKKSGYIEKVILSLQDKGDVTYKCSKDIVSTKEVRGIEIVKKTTEPLLYEEVPEVFIRINNVIRIRSLCKIRLDYTVSSLIVDGEEQEFRFITKQQLKELKLLNQPVKEESVDCEEFC